jgi:WXG100 family type VII secretion target
MAEIRVSPDRLRSSASTLETHKAQADDTLSTMIRTVNDLAGEWTGMAQVDYANLFNENVPQMQTQLRDILENLISELRRIADVFEQTDRDVI